MLFLLNYIVNFNVLLDHVSSSSRSSGTFSNCTRSFFKVMAGGGYFFGGSSKPAVGFLKLFFLPVGSLVSRFLSAWIFFPREGKARERTEGMSCLRAISGSVCARAGVCGPRPGSP